MLKVGAAVAPALHGLVTRVPAGQRRRHRRQDERRAAYLGFERAAASLSTWLAHMPVIAKATPSILAEFVHTRILTDAAEGARAAAAEFLVALLEVRLAGNPEPRAAAEEVAALLAGLAERVPHTRRPRHQRQHEEEQFAEVQRALGEALKQFTLTCRRDLGYAPPLRRHWWQRRRPTSDETWPGGWPGPTVQDLLDKRLADHDQLRAALLGGSEDAESRPI